MAQYAMGFSYAEGKLVPQDFSEALRWYRKAAAQGDAMAQYAIGVRYAYGEGVPRDYAEAVIWYRKSAEQGDATAQRDLGRMYYHGRGVPRDYVQAHLWIGLAASGASGDLKEDCAGWLDIVAQKMTAEQIAEAERLAQQWKLREQATAASRRGSQP